MLMYDLYIMRRTQIYLTDEQGLLLEGRSRATGQSISQLIREAIEGTYLRARATSRADRVRLARKAAGAWTTCAESGEAYVERIRATGRLARLHGER